VNGSLRGDARWTKESKGKPNQVVVSPSPVPSSKLDNGRSGSKLGGDAALMELACRGDWRCDCGEDGWSRVMDRGRKSVLRDKRRRDDVCDAAEAGGSTIGAVARTARRDGARQRRKLELPLAVHTSVSSRAMSWVTPSAGGATSWQTSEHSPSDICAQPSTSTLATNPDLSPE
jgi:hypothetical protein